jgi:hypothetical protein
MTRAMRAAAFWLVVALALIAAPSQAQFKGENLLVTMPPGFKVGHQGSRDGLNMQEWVPEKETVENWSEIVTVQVFLGRRDLDPAQVLQRIQQQWLQACKGSPSAPIAAGTTNGYPTTTVLLHCPLLASTGKPETTMFLAIKGRDSFYMVQRAVRATATPEQVEKMKRYLDAVSVCDSRSATSPCPVLK